MQKLVSLLTILLSTLAIVSSSSSSSASHYHDSISFVPRSSLHQMETPDLRNNKNRNRNNKRTSMSKTSTSEASTTTTSSSSSVTNAIQNTPRGGFLSGKGSEYGGALAFILLDHFFRQAFKANNISFPSQLGGCCILFVLLIVTELIIPGLGDSVFYALAPGSGLLAKWLPVFFVPGLAMLPLAPSMGSSIEVVKVLAVVILGFFFTASTTSFSVLALRKMQGASNAPPRPTTFEISEGSIAQPPPKPYSDEFFSGLVKGLVLSGALSIGITKTLAAAAAEDAKNTFLTSISTPLQAVFLGFATVTGYVWGALLPSSFTKIVHPLVTSTVVTLVIASITGILTGSSFTNILSTYKTGSLHPLSTGAGDVLLYLLGPSVVSFAIAMYSRKKVMVDNLLVVVSAVLVASIGGLFGTAAFVKLLQVGGVGEAGRVLRISLLPRNVTTPLAIAITNILGGDISFAAAVVVLTGIFGATFGARILSSMGVHDPVSRGLGIGAAAQGLGVASLSGEKEAFPFAAIAMVLTAVVATVLVSIPVVKDNLLNMCM